MNYQNELIAKLEAVRVNTTPVKKKTVTTQSLEDKLFQELEDEFEFSQYDLDENDILRTLKIMDILKTYEKVFSHPEAIKIFYVLVKLDIIKATKLFSVVEIEVKTFKIILAQMSKAELIFQNEDKELELTLNGKSLAERLGMFVF